MNRPILSLAATLALVGSSHAAVVVDNFESYSPLTGDMNGQGGWTVTNGTPFDVLDGPVVIIDDYTWDASTQSATVGGVRPLTAGITSLSHSLSVPLQSLTATPSSFSFETAYTESDINFPNRNNFQFVLSTDGGFGNLLTIDLSPGAAGEYDVVWSSGFAGGGVVGTLTANTSTQIQLDTWWNGSAVAYNLTSAGAPISSGTFTGLLATNVVNNFDVNWASTGAGFGNNSITVDNVSLVPEPSSTLLICLAGLGLVTRRKRA